MPPYRAKNQTSTAPYGNTFTAIPFSVMYRPPMITHKPAVNGMHTGKVVVPSGEDSYMDKYGRVCVQFWWDRQRKPNTTDNTLLRVAQSWAGKGWGTYFWPRVDDEVLIDFIEGDPDQPIVVGSVYNGVNMPKYDPAGQYTLSGILTRSSKGGGAANANELRFEDLDGKEQIFMKRPSATTTCTSSTRTTLSSATSSMSRLATITTCRLPATRTCILRKSSTSRSTTKFTRPTAPSRSSRSAPISTRPSAETSRKRSARTPMSTSAPTSQRK